MDILQGKQVLLIDDDHEVNSLMSKILMTAGLNVETVTNIAAAFNSINKKIPHLIFLDINLEGESGFDFLQKLNAQPQRKFISVVILSAHKDPYHIQKALSLGASDYLYKPVYPYDVLLKVRKILNQSKLDTITFSDNEAFSVTASVSGNLIKINEHFCFVESEVKLGETCEMKINSEFFDNLDINEVPLVFSPEHEISKSDKYISRGTFKCSNSRLENKLKLLKAVKT